MDILYVLKGSVFTYATVVQLINTYFMTKVFLYPFAELVYPSNAKKNFIKLSLIRLIILIGIDFFCYILFLKYMLFSFIIVATFSILDFLFSFIGWLIIMPILIHKIKPHNRIDSLFESKEEKKPTVKLTCQKCGTEFKITDSVCSKCGASFVDDNVKVEEITDSKD